MSWRIRWWLGVCATTVVAFSLLPGTAQPAVPESCVEVDASALGAPVVYGLNLVSEFQSGVLPNSSYAGVSDTYIEKWLPQHTHGGEDMVRIGQDGAYRALLRFDLSAVTDAHQIPSEAVVVAARLYLYCYWRSPGATMQTQVYKVLRPWDDMMANWRAASSYENWDMEGCSQPETDRSLGEVSTSALTQQGAWQQWDVTSPVQEWVHGPSTNHGLLIESMSHCIANYYGSEFSWDRFQRPKLQVEWYVPDTPTPTATSTSTRTPTSTRTATPTATGTATSSPTPTQTEVPIYPVCLPLVLK